LSAAASPPNQDFAMATPPKDDGNLESRRRELGAALSRKDADEQRERDAAGRRRENSSGVAYAVKISSEFIAGVVVGSVIGLLIDKFAGTSPWGLIVFLLLGFCAGVLNVLRTAGLIAVSKSERGVDYKPATKDQTPPGNAWKDDEED
jgi:ATP synthase protein I